MRPEGSIGQVADRQAMKNRSQETGYPFEIGIAALPAAWQRTRVLEIMIPIVADRRRSSWLEAAWLKAVRRTAASLKCVLWRPKRLTVKNHQTDRRVVRCRYDDHGRNYRKSR